MIPRRFFTIDTGEWSSWLETKSCNETNCKGNSVRIRVCKSPYFYHYNKSCLKTQCKRNFKCLGKNGYSVVNETETAACDKCICKG